ncbi:PhzF family phenazine biosynthesis protein [Maricaulis sp. CAU 1757]
MTRIPYFEIHAFADPDRPFSGNPAGVCLLEAFPEDAVLAGIAQANNLSETAFLVARGGDCWDLRWFTPSVEVDLCGHATFAAGAVLFEGEKVDSATARFLTRSGELRVTREHDGLAMQLPKNGYEPCQPSDELRAALGFAGDPESVFTVNRLHGADYQMWVVDGEKTVRQAQPDFSALRRIGCNVILTARGDESDFVSRFFAPASGVDEDPVTGSAHCTLGPYWSERLAKSTLRARQIGPRPGALSVESNDTAVTLKGLARSYLDGHIRI